MVFDMCTQKCAYVTQPSGSMHSIKLMQVASAALYEPELLPDRAKILELLPMACHSSQRKSH